MKNFFSKIKHQNIAEEFDESKCKALIKLFLEEKFQDAVDQAEKYFIKSYNGTYKQFIDEVKSTQKTNCCLFSWNTSTLSGVCMDCQTTSSCLCIPCFLAKHHENHQSYIQYFDSGSCDCGDSSCIKPSGFCPHHPGPDANPDITQMTKETRQKFITVFRAAFTAAFLYSPYGRSKKEKNKAERYKKPKKLIEYIKQFIPYGDGIRRCAAYAILPVAKEHFFKVVQTDAGLTEKILSLFGLMISDVYFRDRMSIISFREFNQLFNQLGTCIYNKNIESGKYNSLHLFFDFTYHFITDHSVLYSLNKGSFEWSDFLMGYLSNIYMPISMTHFEYDINFETGIFSHFNYVHKFLTIVVGLDDQHSNIQKFIDNYSYFLNRNERAIRFFVRTAPQDETDDGYTAFHVTLFLSLINSVFGPKCKYSSPLNTEYSLSKIFQNLVEYLDRANIRAESILNAQEKCPISTFVMLHSLFFVVLSGCKNPKEELKSLCDKIKWNFDFFCSIVVVCPLRAIAALFSYSKFSNLNNGHKYSIRSLATDATVTFKQMFGLVQLILSICDNKSKVMNSILTTFGVFDDISIYKDKLNEYEYERQKSLFDLAYFDCSIFVLSLLTDNTVLSFDDIKFKRFRVIELLKRSKATAKEIEDHVDEKLSNPVFADDLLEYIERVIKKNGGSYFRLKSDGDFNPFFPVIMQMDRLNLLGKYNDQLLPLSDCYEDLNRGISLKECFKTPEFFCLCFLLLSSPSSNALMKKVGLAMSMCFINNTTKFPPQSYKDNSPVTIVAPSLKELIKNVAENDLLKKENWLTANLQIENNDNKQEKLSLIKLILMQENLGKLVIEKTGLPEDLCRNKIDEKQQAEKDRINQLIKEKKAKAALLKQRLMKDFQNKRKQFNNLSSSDIKIEQKEEEKKKTETNNNNNSNLKIQSEDDDEFNSSQQILTDGMNNVLCNVCLSQQDDIFGVPCLSVPSILPSLVSSQTHKKSKNINEHQVAYMMNICSHFVHYKCYVKVLSEAVKADPNAKTYHCMMDRGLRNCFLPVFDQVRIDNNNNISYDENDEEEQNLDLFLEKPPVMTKVAITDFIRRAFDEKTAADILLPLRSFAAAVLMLEVRHRNRPDVLDSQTVSLLLRNFLLTIYHGLHVRVSKSNIESDKYKDDPLLRLIIEVVKSEDPRTEYHDKVKEILQSINKKSSSSRVLEFLRRAAIIEDVAIKSPKNQTSFIDWDEVLSEENLIAKFEFKQTSFHKMKRFKMIKLPKRFIGLYSPPYKVDICDSSILKALDLITGEVVKFKRPKTNRKSGDNNDDADAGFNESPYKPIEQYEKDVYNGGLAMYLVLTGDKASSVMFHSEALRKTWNVDGFYVDQFGDTDHGFKRGLITKLSKDNQSNTLDKFMSGEIALY